MICTKCRTNSIDIPASLVCSLCKKIIIEKHSQIDAEHQAEEEKKSDSSRSKIWRESICTEINGIPLRFKNVTLRDVKKYNYAGLQRLLQGKDLYNIIIINGPSATGKTYLAIKFFYMIYAHFDCSLYYASLRDITENNYDADRLFSANYVIIDDVKESAIKSMSKNCLYTVFRRLTNSPKNTLLVSTSDGYKNLLCEISEKESDVIGLEYVRLDCTEQYSKDSFNIKIL